VERGVEWFLTKESGRLPILCGNLRALVESVPGVLLERPARSLFVVKVSGQADRVEVVVVPLAGTTVVWFEGAVLMMILESVRSGSWATVMHVACFLVCKPPCLRGCQGICTCEEKTLWAGCGWRRVGGLELNVPRYVGWWTGVTDAVGRVGARSWLRCPCGEDHTVIG
jgi:hypothetical protein